MAKVAKKNKGRIHRNAAFMQKKERTNSFAYGDVIRMDEIIRCPKCQLWKGTLREFVDKHKPKCLLEVEG